MGLPNIRIIFQSKAIKAILQGAVGVVAMVMKDTHVVALTKLEFTDVADVPGTKDLDQVNIDYLSWCFLGTPKKVIAIVIPDESANYNEALNYLETIKWNIGCIPGIAAGDVANVASWVKSMRDNKKRKVLCVLPNSPSDHEGIINFTTNDIKVKVGEIENTYSSTQYTARIAGLIAGLPLTVAPTFQVLTEVSDVPKLTDDEASAKIDAGEFILYHDGSKVKVGRGVTSLVTTTETKGEDWKKVKLTRIYDKWHIDVKETIEDEYIGKVQNSYENKLLLCAAINSYNETLEQQRVLDPGKSKASINLAAQKTYLKSIGYTTVDGRSVDEMTEQEIKEAYTRDKVFVGGPVRGLDAIEDVELVVNM